MIMVNSKKIDGSGDGANPHVIQNLVTIIVIIGVFITLILFLRLDKPMSCEEYKEEEAIDPRFQIVTSNPWHMNLCDSVSKKVDKQ